MVDLHKNPLGPHVRLDNSSYMKYNTPSWSMWWDFTLIYMKRFIMLVRKVFTINSLVGQIMDNAYESQNVKM